MGIGPAHRNGKTQDTKEGEGRGRTVGGGKGQPSDVTTEIKSNANTKLHYPSHTLANPLSPCSLHSFYTFPSSPHDSSLSFVSPSPRLSCASSPFLRRHPFPLSSLPTMPLFPSSDHHHHHHLLPPPHLTYPWRITPLPFVLYGAGTANRRATESVACYIRA